MLLGDQRPRLLCLPSGVVTRESGREAIEVAGLARLELDEWQQWLLIESLGETDEYLWAAFEILIIIARQNGKGPYYVGMPILTLDGWTTFADIRPGQYVYGGDGKPVRVVARSEVFHDLPCYEVTFTDGSQHIVAGSHLWHVKDRDSGRWAVITTGHMASRYQHVRPDNGRNEYRYRVRCDAVPDTPRADLPIDPYLLGMWLGDGIRSAPAIVAGAEDREWVTDRIARAGAKVIRVDQHDHGHAWTLSFRLDAKMRDGFESRCRRLGLWGSKHIPEIYLTASIGQRLSLLAGLMDSDGSIAVTNRSPQAEFSTSLPRLAEDFHRLARSLGIRVRPQRRATTHADNWRFLWTPTFDPFEMPRKSSRYKPPASARQSLMSITNIRPVQSVPTRCIQVDRPDGVYLTGHHFTPTHNSYLEARELAGLFLFGEELLIHTAHQFKTSLEAFRRILRLIQSVPQFDQRVMRVSKSHGEEGIELKATPAIIQGSSSDYVTPSVNQRLNFFARSEQAGKGFTGDLLVYDESQDLEAADTASTLPTLSARPNPQVVYTGNAGTRKSTQVAKVRRRMLAGGDGSLFGAEWSIVPHSDDCREDCAEHDDDDSPRSLAKANPSLGVRRRNRTGITLRSARNEAKAMGVHSVEYRRERLGVGDYPDPSEGWAVIAQGWWTATMVRGNEAYRPAAPHAFAVSTTKDRRWTTIGLAGKRTDTRVGVEIIKRERGTAWAPDEIADLNATWRPCCWVLDSRDQAASMIGDDGTIKGVQITVMTGQDMTHACGQIFDAYKDGTIAHTDDPELRRAIAGADKRDMEAAWVFDRRGDGALDLGPLLVITEAHWGYLKFGPGADYDVGESVGWDASEVVRLLQMGVYSAPFDIIRLRRSGLLDDDDLKLIEAAGFKIPAGI